MNFTNFIFTCCVCFGLLTPTNFRRNKRHCRHSQQTREEGEGKMTEENKNIF